MKNIWLAAAAILLCIAVVGCNTLAASNPNDNPVTGDNPSAAILPGQNNPGETGWSEMTVTVLYKFDSTVLVARPDQPEPADLILLDLAGQKIVDREDDSLVELKDVVPGMLLGISYDGNILESYPCQLGEVGYVYTAGKQEVLADFYFALVDLIYQQDPALNDGITEITLDLDGVNNLSQIEKQALIYLVYNQYGKEVYQDNREGLLANGALDTNGTHYENGVLIKITDTGVQNGTFTFTLEKWRSALGAIGAHGATANKIDGAWQYSIENWYMA